MEERHAEVTGSVSNPDIEVQERVCPIISISNQEFAHEPAPSHSRWNFLGCKHSAAPALYPRGYLHLPTKAHTEWYGLW